LLSLKLLLIQTFCALSWLKRWVRQIFINLKKVEKRSSITKDDFSLILQWVSLMVWELSQVNSWNGHQRNFHFFLGIQACCLQVLSVFCSLFLSRCGSFLYLSISLFISVSVFLFLSIFIFLCLSVFISVYLSLSPSLSVYLCLSLSMSVFAYLCLSLSLIVSPSLSRAVLLFLSVKLICVEQHGHVLLLVLLKYHMCFSQKLFKYLQYFDFIVVAFGFIMEIHFN
jgi:hypothetical protein